MIVKTPPRLPTLFISHGAPTWAMEPGLAGPLIGTLGQSLPRPQAVLVVSAHWMTRDVLVTGSSLPPTIHDFGGFPEALYRLEYPAPGHPAFAKLTLETLRAAGWPASIDEQRGLDHGAWVPMRYLFPQADVPVFQVSMPVQLTAESAWKLGEALAPLSGQGVLIVGSGGLTHNLRELSFDGETEEPYAREFVAWVRDAVERHDDERLKSTLAAGPNASRAHPTPEHFLPLLVAAGASDRNDSVTVLPGGMVHGALSMESYVFGA